MDALAMLSMIRDLPQKITGRTTYHGRTFTWTLEHGDSLSADILIFDMYDAVRYVDTVAGMGNPNLWVRGKSLLNGHEDFYNYFSKLWAAVFFGADKTIVYQEGLLKMTAIDVILCARVDELGAVLAYLDDVTLPLVMRRWLHTAWLNGLGTADHTGAPYAESSLRSYLIGSPYQVYSNVTDAALYSKAAVTVSLN